MTGVIALVYLLCVAGSAVVLAVALRRRPAPTSPTPAAPNLAALPAAEAEVRVILAAAVQLAARLSTAA